MTGPAVDTAHCRHVPVSCSKSTHCTTKPKPTPERFSHYAERTQVYLAQCTKDSLYHVRLTPVMQKTHTSQKIHRSGFPLGIILREGSVKYRYFPLKTAKATSVFALLFFFFASSASGALHQFKRHYAKTTSELFAECGKDSSLILLPMCHRKLLMICPNDYIYALVK